MPSLLLALLLAARPFTPEELLATRRAGDVQVSPDGRWASFTVRQKSLASNKDEKDIWLLPLPSGPARQFTRNGTSEHARWSPDGKRILIVRDGQLWSYPLEGGDGQQITSLSGGADGGVYSPDGRFVAFTSEVYPQCQGDEACNKDRAEKREKSGVHARIVDHLFARHWTEWKEGRRTHVFVMPAAGGPARDVTPLDSDWPSFRLGGGDDFRFTSDSELIVSSKPAQREAWSTNGDLWSIERAGGPPKNLTPDNHGDDAQPRPSPDGRWLAWTAQARDGYEADQWKLKIQERRSGRVTTVSLETDDVGSIAWRRDSKGLVVSTVQEARYWLYSVSLDGKVRRFSGSPAGGDDFDLAPDGTAVVAAAGLTHPPEVVTLKPGGQPQRLSHFNDEQYKDLDLGTAEELWFDSKDGSKIHSWVIRPAHPPAKLPLLVLIHGGPQGSWEDSWTMRWNGAVFAARGYVVLETDFHGSLGYGQKFKEQISGDWGGLAYDDVLRAVDAAEKLPFVEPGHTCAAGASFGGYMIDWIAGHTGRFQCLVSHDGVYDLTSAYGSTEELWFPEWEFRGPPWENPELYRTLSPSSYAQNFKTPTLVVQGELDFRVPVEQGLGMFTALQRRGVESRLLYFPDEGHWVLKPRNSQLWYHTVLDFIDAHARPTSKQAARP
ncbi:MAG TPA: S9 family peptidase [Myxococcales bacterium]|nr:S9 family peptidase [Myxococcales bacterium]